MKNPVGRKLFSPKTIQSKEKVKEEVSSKEDELVKDNFDFRSEDDFDGLCNVVSVLPRDYDCVTWVVEPEDCEEEEMAIHMPICYFVMNNGCIEEHNTFFERTREGMKSLLKPLFIREKVEKETVNKILVDGGEAVNLMPHFLLEKIGKFDTDLRPHNMVLSNYKGKTRQTMVVIQVDVTVGSITRPIIFMVITSRARYNFLLG